VAAQLRQEVLALTGTQTADAALGVDPGACAAMTAVRQLDHRSAGHSVGAPDPPFGTPPTVRGFGAAAFPNRMFGTRGSAGGAPCG
jgi:hypothetical protein